MAITCTWSVNNMTHKDSDGGVILVYWSCVAASDGSPVYTALEAGKLQCDPDPTSPDYIPYADLTENDVLGWVWDTVDKAAIEADRTAKVQAQIDRANTLSSGLPWETAPDA